LKLYIQFFIVRPRTFQTTLVQAYFLCKLHFIQSNTTQVYFNSNYHLRMCATCFSLSIQKPYKKDIIRNWGAPCLQSLFFIMLKTWNIKVWNLNNFENAYIKTFHIFWSSCVVVRVHITILLWFCIFWLAWHCLM